MLRFKKTKGVKEELRVPDQISNSILTAQRKAADYLNRKTAHWSPRRIKIVLFLFCLLTGNTCLFIVGKAILTANGPPKHLRVQNKIVPPHLKNTVPVDTPEGRSIPP